MLRILIIEQESVRETERREEREKDREKLGERREREIKSEKEIANK